jgi:flagellar biosynthesis/type III secretory pathway chaperone
LNGVDLVLPLVDALRERLAEENALLRQGEVKRALVLSESRVPIVERLEAAMAELKELLPGSIRPQAEALIALNRENAALLQAALAGQARAQEIARGLDRPAGYAADGSKLFPVTEKKPIRF